jgi:predicted neuraminidase
MISGKIKKSRVMILSGVFCLAGLVAAWLESSNRSSERAKIRFVPQTTPLFPDLQAQTLPVSTTSPAPEVHSASSVVLPGGRIRAFWFAGSKEGAADVAIWSAEFDGASWQQAHIVLDRETLARGTRRFIRKLGNPVIHLDGDGRLHLYVVSVSLGGWSGSAVNRVVYHDDACGEIAQIDRLIASPILNLGTLVRGLIFEQEDGIDVLPAYHESIRKFPQILRVGRDGRVTHRKRVKVEGKLFQPWALVGEGGDLEMFLRRGEGTEARVHHVISSDNGEKWSEPQALEIENPNSGISAVRLNDGSYLKAVNPNTKRRSELVLLRGETATGPWHHAFDVDTAARQEDEGHFTRVEYSYPWLKLDAEGVVHLFYTWNRREIRHLRIGQRQLIDAGGGL